MIDMGDDGKIADMVHEFQWRRVADQSFPAGRSSRRTQSSLRRPGAGACGIGLKWGGIIALLWLEKHVSNPAQDHRLKSDIFSKSPGHRAHGQKAQTQTQRAGQDHQFFTRASERRLAQ